MKRCQSCAQEKPLSAFTRRAASGDGLQPRCKECLKAQRNPLEGKIAYARHRESERERGVRYRRDNVEKRREKDKRYYALTKERQSEYGARYRETHPEQCRERLRRWAQENPDKHNAKCARARACQLNAMPKWATQFIMDEAYSLAALRTRVTGFEWHVDHTVPLKSDLVCGLHVEHNLQVIPGVLNIKKRNRSWPDMPTEERV